MDTYTSSASPQAYWAPASAERETEREIDLQEQIRKNKYVAVLNELHFPNQTDLHVFV